MKRFTVLTVALVASVAFLVGVIVAGGLTSAPVVSTAPHVAAVQPAALPRPAAAMGVGASVVNFADVAERINAAVVNIDATSSVAAGREPRDYRRGPGGGSDGPPLRDWEIPRQGAGSGFIIDRSGHILTNFHVIENADRIRVTLADGRAFRGEVVGTDPAIDIALLRIDGGHALPEAPLGNSDDLRVGEWVCAIGNPLGYVHSVTVGVVSFIGRKLFDQSLDDYIQTDAAINFGNSGGPLINSRGEVIGINSAISSRASNIGFAVPINQAVAILPQLKSRGRVSRGFLGVVLTDVTQQLQRSLGLSVSLGALVQDVTPGSPAERAGVRPYDVIVEMDGQPILANDELIRTISARLPGTAVRLEVVRDGRRWTLPVKLAERPLRREDADRMSGLGDRPSRPPQAPPELPLGVAVREIDRGTLGRLDIPDSVDGVVVSRVDPTGSAFSALRRGFVVMEINRKPIRSVVDFDKAVSAAQPGDVLTFFYYDPSQASRGLATVTVDDRR